MFSKLRQVIALVCVSALLAAPGAGQSAIAQSSTTGSTSGVTISASGSWQHDEIASSSENGIDSMVFTNANAHFIVSAGTADIASSFSALGVTQAVTDIDVAETYALRGIDADGVPFGVFQVAVGNSVQTLIAPVSSFGTAMSDAQAHIQVDGAGVMNGVDGTALASTIADTMGSGDAAADASASPILGTGVAPVADTSESTSEEAVTESEGATEEVTESTAQAPTGGTGFVDDNTWVSPQFGTTITWTEGWSPLADETGGPTFTTIASDWETTDELCLLSDSSNSFIACITIRKLTEFTQLFWGPNAVEETVNIAGVPYFAVVTTDTGGMRGSFDLDGFGEIVEQRMGDGFVIFTTVFGELDLLADQYEAMQQGVQIDESRAFSLMDAAALRTEVDAAIASMPELNQQREQILADMGMVDEHHYISVAMGCDVEWSAAHRMSSHQMNPIGTFIDWDNVTNAEISMESIGLHTDDFFGTNINVVCYESITSLDSLYNWANPEENPSPSTVTDGTRVMYLTGVFDSFDGEEATYDISILVKPASGPVAVVNLWGVTKDQLAAMEPGTLILNGVDIVEAMEEDGFIDQLP